MFHYHDRGVKQSHIPLHREISPRAWTRATRTSCCSSPRCTRCRAGTWSSHLDWKCLTYPNWRTVFRGKNLVIISDKRYENATRFKTNPTYHGPATASTFSPGMLSKVSLNLSYVSNLHSTQLRLPCHAGTRRCMIFKRNQIDFDNNPSFRSTRAKQKAQIWN